MSGTTLQLLNNLNCVYRFLTMYKWEEAVIGESRRGWTHPRRTSTGFPLLLPRPGHVGGWGA